MKQLPPERADTDVPRWDEPFSSWLRERPRLISDVSREAAATQRHVLGALFFWAPFLGLTVLATLVAMYLLFYERHDADPFTIGYQSSDSEQPETQGVGYVKAAAKFATVSYKEQGARAILVFDVPSGGVLVVSDLVSPLACGTSIDKIAVAVPNTNVFTVDFRGGADRHTSNAAAPAHLECVVTRSALDESFSHRMIEIKNDIPQGAAEPLLHPQPLRATFAEHESDGLRLSGVYTSPVEPNVGILPPHRTMRAHWVEEGRQAARDVLLVALGALLAFGATIAVEIFRPYVALRERRFRVTGRLPRRS